MSTPVQAPSGFAPVSAVSYGALGADAVFVDANHPLPVAIAGISTGAAPGLGIIGIGQSNVDPAYPALTYTPTAMSGTGTAQTITIAAGYSLRIGDTVQAKLTGATPAGYNDAAYVPYVVGGTAPNGITLTRAGATTGAMTAAGTLVVNMRTSYPQAWVSATDPTTTAPLPPRDYAFGYRGMDGTNEVGSPLIALRDELAAKSGRRVAAADIAIGSSSLIKHWVGIVGQWNPSTHYRSRRAPTPGDPQDRGSLGDQISVYAGSKGWCMMECTAGGDQMYASNCGSLPTSGAASSPQMGSGYLVTVTGGVSGTSAPDWTTITGVGSTLSDGALTWTCVSCNYTTYPSDQPGYFPSIDYRYKVIPRGKVGFDPFGLIGATLQQAGLFRRQGLVPVVTMIGHESDINTAGTTWFTDALQALSDALTTRRIFFAPSMTYFNTVSGSASQFADVSSRVKNFLAANTANPFVCQNAVNLYDYFGQTPGANGLCPQRDNLHPNEDIHASALTCTLAGTAMADGIWQNVATIFA